MSAATTLPTLHAALLLADHVSPAPSLASDALRVLRAALADALAMPIAELLYTSEKYEAPEGTELQRVSLVNERINSTFALLNGFDDCVHVRGLLLRRDRKANLVWGRDAFDADQVVAKGVGLESCERAVDWAIAQPQRHLT